MATKMAIFELSRQLLSCYVGVKTSRKIIIYSCVICCKKKKRVDCR